MIGVKYLVVFCAFLSLAKSAPTKEKRIIFTKVEYELNKEILSMDVNLKNNTEGYPSVDLNAQLFVDLDDNVYIHNVISKRGSGVEYHALMKSGKVHLCEFNKRPEKEPFIKTLIDALGKYGEMMFHCPVKKGKFWVKNFRLEGSTLPEFTPVGDYLLDFSVTKKVKDHHVQIFRMLWYATLTNHE